MADTSEKKFQEGVYEVQVASDGTVRINPGLIDKENQTLPVHQVALSPGFVLLDRGSSNPADPTFGTFACQNKTNAPQTLSWTARYNPPIFGQSVQTGLGPGGANPGPPGIVWSSSGGESLSGVWRVPFDKSAAIQYPTIQDALNAANPNPGDKDQIIVGSGLWMESIVFPADVQLKGVGSPGSVVIAGAIATGTRVTLAAGATLEGVTVVCPTDAADAITFAGTGPTDRAKVANCLLEGAGGTGAGIALTALGHLDVVQCSFIDGAAGMGPCIEQTGAGTSCIEEVGAYCTGTTAFRCVAGLSEVSFINTDSNLTALTSGMIVGTCTLSGKGLQLISGCTNGIHIVGDNLIMQLLGGSNLKGSVFDILVDPALLGTGTKITTDDIAFRQERFSLPAAWAVTFDALVMHVDEGENDDPQFSHAGQLSVGKTIRGENFISGQGAPTTLNMFVFSESPAGAFLDNTAAAQSRTGSLFSLWQSTAIGNIAYFGNAIRTFPFAEVNVDTDMTLGTGEIVWEFWSGAAWTSFLVMTADNESPFNQYAQAVFERANIEKIRFGNMSGWAPNVVNGQAGFWVRARIVAAPTTIPTLQQVKLGTNQFRTSTVGFPEKAGLAEGVLDLVWHRNLVDDLSGASPGNATLDLSANSLVAPNLSITITGVDNQFNNNAVDGVGGTISVPEGLDTSRPITLEVIWYPNTNNAGDVEIQTMDVGLRATDPVGDGTPIPNDQSAITTINAGEQFRRISNRFDFDIPDLVPGDDVAIAFLRDATAANLDDTLAGNIKILDTLMTGTFWR